MNRERGAAARTLEGGLVVMLERFSIEQTENVFMMIEQPEDPGRDQG